MQLGVSARKVVIRHRSAVINSLNDRLLRACDDDEVLSNARPMALAYFLDAMAHGIAAQECSDTQLSDREEVDDVALGAVDRPDAMLTGSAELKLEQRTLAALS
jgi:hypothetical protein